MRPRDENGYSTCPPYCECEECQADGQRWCECCDAVGSYRGDLEGYFCDVCTGIPCRVHPETEDE